MNIVDCGHDADIQKTEITTGYGIDKDNKKICFECCGKFDKEEMLKTGKATLYLEPSKGIVSNWPGTLKFNGQVRKGNHNIARNRYDVWFYGPDNNIWHGVTYGDNTQICHCKRTKHQTL